MIKKKGQIVPKYLCRSVEKKAQHLVKFGADVEITGRTIKLLSEGCAIEVPAVTHVLKKKRQRTVKGFVMVDVYIIGLPFSGGIIGCSIKPTTNWSNHFSKITRYN